MGVPVFDAKAEPLHSPAATVDRTRTSFHFTMYVPCMICSCVSNAVVGEVGVIYHISQRERRAGWLHWCKRVTLHTPMFKDMSVTGVEAGGRTIPMTLRLSLLQTSNMLPSSSKNLTNESRCVAKKSRSIQVYCIVKLPVHSAHATYRVGICVCVSPAAERALPAAEHVVVFWRQTHHQDSTPL